MEESLAKIEINKDIVKDTISSDITQTVNDVEDGPEDRHSVTDKRDSIIVDETKNARQDSEKHDDDAKEMDQPKDRDEGVKEFERENSSTSSPSKEDCSSSGSSVEVIHTTTSELHASSSQEKGTYGLKTLKNIWSFHGRTTPSYDIRFVIFVLVESQNRF